MKHNKHNTQNNDINRLISQLLKTKYGLPLFVIGIIGVGVYMLFFENDTSTDAHLDPHIRQPVELARHIDGDTTQFYFNGNRETFRYIIIDTPELDHTHGNHEPYATEARDFVEEKLNNASSIYVEFDDGEKQDHYDRYLAYVYADDMNLNIELVRRGLASVRYTNTENTKYLDELYEAEAHAQNEQRGIWSE